MRSTLTKAWPRKPPFLTIFFITTSYAKAKQKRIFTTLLTTENRGWREKKGEKARRDPYGKNRPLHNPSQMEWDVVTR